MLVLNQICSDLTEQASVGDVIKVSSCRVKLFTDRISDTTDKRLTSTPDSKLEVNFKYAAY